MVWAKIDDQMKDHPKILAAGAIAELIQYRAIQYCCRYLTDGVLPSGAVPSLLIGLEHIAISEGGLVQPAHWPAYMVAKGLWSTTKKGYIVHDFLHYNPSRADVLGLRGARRKAGIKGAKVTNSRRLEAANDAASASSSAATHDAASAAANGRQVPRQMVGKGYGSSTSTKTSTKTKTKNKNPVANDGGNSTERVDAIVDKFEFLVSQGSNQPSSRQPSGATPSQIGEPRGTTTHPTRSPPQGTFEAIRRRLASEHEDKTRDEIEHMAIVEYQKALEAARG